MPRSRFRGSWHDHARAVRQHLRRDWYQYRSVDTRAGQEGFIVELWIEDRDRDNTFSGGVLRFSLQFR